MRRRKFATGFTIIELLIVITIISLLATLVIVSVSSAQKRSRDVKRQADMTQIQKALAVYHTINGAYPGPVGAYNEGTGEGCNGWDTSAIDRDNSGIPILDPLFEEGYISVMPTDPSNSTTCNGNQYRYFLYPAGANGCDVSRGMYYVFGSN